MNWLRSLPTPGKIIAGGIGLVIILALIYAVTSCVQETEDKDNANLVNQGELIERGAATTEVINSVEKANTARDDRSPVTERVVCEKYDRNCQDSE